MKKYPLETKGVLNGALKTDLKKVKKLKKLYKKKY